MTQISIMNLDNFKIFQQSRNLSNREKLTPPKEWDILCLQVPSCATWPTSSTWTGMVSSFLSLTGPLCWPQFPWWPQSALQATPPISERTVSKPLTEPSTSKLDTTCCTPWALCATSSWWASTGSCSERSSKTSTDSTKTMDGADPFIWSSFTPFQAPPSSSMRSAPTQFWKRIIGSSLLTWLLFTEYSAGSTS